MRPGRRGGGCDLGDFVPFNSWDRVVGEEALDHGLHICTKWDGIGRVRQEALRIEADVLGQLSADRLGDASGLEVLIGYGLHRFVDQAPLLKYECELARGQLPQA